MSSILTNSSAMAALQTLRKTGDSLSVSQQRISSGLRVGQASDNAAYWSIATTMRSDEKAVSAVSSALGIGAAKADTAYAGMSETISVLSDFRARLVSATEAGIDPTKVQAELDQLKDELKTIAQSASFNGQNWLSTDIADMDDSALNQDQVASAFTRNSDGTVHVGATAVDLSKISLLNATGGGALQVDKRSLGLIGGLRDQTRDLTSSAGYQDFNFTGPGQFIGAQQVSFDLLIDQSAQSSGQNFNVVINKSTVDAALGTSDGRINTSSDWQAVVRQGMQDAGVGTLATVHSNGSTVGISTTETSGEAGSSIAVSNVVSTAAGGAFGFQNTASGKRNGAYATASFDFTAFRVHAEATFSFNFAVNGGATQGVTVNRAMVDAALGTTNGKIDTAAQLATVLNAAVSGKGVQFADDSGTLTLQADPAANPAMGARSRISFGNVTDNIGALADFDILDVDITKPGASVKNYLMGVESMLKRATSGAAIVGTLQTRIGMQADFADALSKSLASGIGRLVDADMEEESSRLTALQTQQQLAIQSLSIANNAPQNLLALFRA